MSGLPLAMSAGREGMRMNWEYTAEDIPAEGLPDALATFARGGWELVSVVVQEYVERTNVSAETGMEQRALVVGLYRLVGRKAVGGGP